MEVTQSAKLANVCYDIRGPVLQEAKRMEAEGHHVLKLNIGNPAPFGFDAPEEILQDVILNLPSAHGYGDSKGLLSARRAVVQYYQGKASDRRRHRGRLPRQRRLRTDRDVAAGAAEQRRRGAHPGAGLPAVDGGGQPVRRPGGALPLRRERRLAARPRRPRREDHVADQGAGRDQPQQPHRRGVLPRDAGRTSSSWPAGTTWSCSPTRSTTRSSTTTPSTSALPRSRRTCCA